MRFELKMMMPLARLQRTGSVWESGTSAPERYAFDDGESAASPQPQRLCEVCVSHLQPCYFSPLLFHHIKPDYDVMLPPL